MDAQTQHADDRFVIGIDFGTLSGRAVVVRVSDGAELGSAVHEYSHARHGPRLTALPAPTRRCRRSGRFRCPPTTSTC